MSSGVRGDGQTPRTDGQTPRTDGQTPGTDGRTPRIPPRTASATAASTQHRPPAGSVRASLAAASAVDGVEPLVVEAAAGGAELAGPDERGRAILRTGSASGSGPGSDSEPVEAEDLSILILDPPLTPGPLRRRARIREVVVDGWRVEVEVEPAHLAALRERATRGHGAAGRGGPTEVRAIIPGRVVGVSVRPGDDVVAGQQILVVEAMKMQNELRAPRDGRIERVAVEVGQTIEVGDLLLVLT